MKQQQQYIGLKIQALLKARDLKQQSLAKAMKIGPRHLSKKIGIEANFSPEQVSIAADFLGVTPAYLADTSRHFNLGDEIPPDAIATPPPTSSEAMDPVAALLKIAESNMQVFKDARAKASPELVQEVNKELVEQLNGLTAAVQMLHGQVQTLTQKIDDLADSPGGSHDPD